MSYSEVLEKYLYRIARGDLSDTSIILPFLLKNIIYSKVKPVKENSDFQKFTFPLIIKSGTNYLPVYIKNKGSGDLKEDESIIEIGGQAIIDSLPEDVGLIIEPDTSLEVAFLPELLRKYKTETKDKEHNPSKQKVESRNKTQNDSEEDDESKKSEKEGRSKIRYLNPGEFRSSGSDNPEIPLYNQLEKSMDSIETASDDKEEDISFSLFGSKTNLKSEVDADEEKIVIRPKKSFFSKKDSEQPSSKLSLIDIENKLKTICLEFPSLREAYSLPHSSLHSELVVGVLAENWTSDDRFNFIEKVADVAKEVYGYAGAIEVYDDLNDTHSKSWDMFKMIPPFYTLDYEENSSLSDEIEIEEDDEKSNFMESVGRIGKSGLKLFGK